MRATRAGLSVERMAQRPTAPERRTYLVEHYRPGMRVEELRRSAARVRDMVARMEQEGRQVELVSSTVVPRDEYFLSVLSAASEQLAARGVRARRNSIRTDLDRRDRQHEARSATGEDRLAVPASAGRRQRQPTLL